MATSIVLRGSDLDGCAKDIGRKFSDAVVSIISDDEAGRSMEAEDELRARLESVTTVSTRRRECLSDLVAETPRVEFLRSFAESPDGQTLMEQIARKHGFESGAALHDVFARSLTRNILAIGGREDASLREDISRMILKMKRFNSSLSTERALRALEESEEIDLAAYFRTHFSPLDLMHCGIW